MIQLFTLDNFSSIVNLSENNYYPVLSYFLFLSYLFFCYFEVTVIFGLILYSIYKEFHYNNKENWNVNNKEISCDNEKLLEKLKKFNMKLDLNLNYLNIN
jgi:hypothetical protein